MLSNIERRSRQIEQHENVEHADLDYDDGEIVVIALCEKFEEDFEDFVDSLGLDIRSGPKYVGIGTEVVVG